MSTTKSGLAARGPSAPRGAAPLGVAAPLDDGNGNNDEAEFDSGSEAEE